MTPRSDLLNEIEKALTDEVYDGGSGALSEDQFARYVHRLAGVALAVVDRPIRCDYCGDTLPSVKSRAHIPTTPNLQRLGLDADKVVCPECVARANLAHQRTGDARADIVAELRWLADARKEYETDTFPSIAREVQIARMLADILERKTPVSEGGEGFGWMPSWRWEEWDRMDSRRTVQGEPEPGRRLDTEFRADLVDAAKHRIGEVWADVPEGVDAETLAQNVVAAQEFLWIARGFPIAVAPQGEPTDDGHDGWCGCEKCESEPQSEPTEAPAVHLAARRGGKTQAMIDQMLAQANERGIRVEVVYPQGEPTDAAVAAERERAARHADEGYRVGERCDDIAKRIRSGEPAAPVREGGQSRG